MAMISDALKDAGVPVVVDVHAGKRAGSSPEAVTVEYLGEGDAANLLAAAVGRGASVFVDVSGRVFVLAEGGSGVVAVSGTNSTPEQVAATTAVLDCLHDRFGLSVKAPARGKRKKDAPVESEVVEVAEPVVEADEPVDLEVDGRPLPADWYPQEDDGE